MSVIQPGENKKLEQVARVGFDWMKSIPGAEQDFLAELHANITFDTAYFDPVDGLPVGVLNVETSKAASDHKGNIHSGALCVMFDHLSTYCVFADPNWWVLPDGNISSVEVSPHIASRAYLEMGLSRNIKVHQQSPIKAGSAIKFVTKVLENSPKSTYFFSQIFDGDGKLLATGHHDKVKLTKAVKPKV